MKGGPVPPLKEPHDDEPRGRPDRPTTPLIQGLERFRERAQRRLDQIEALARERAGTLPSEPSDRERELQRRVAELEEAQRRLQVETDRREQERREVVEQLEHDRRLLTEAWERLEREQVEGLSTAHAPARPAPIDRPPPPVVRSAVPSDQNDPVAQAILRQFQALRRDVRRNTNGRYSS